MNVGYFPPLFLMELNGAFPSKQSHSQVGCDEPVWGQDDAESVPVQQYLQSGCWQTQSVHRSKAIDQGNNLHNNWANSI